MSRRGIYRGVYSALIDDPDFQWLSPAPRHLLLTMRLSKEAGPACIFRYYPAMLSVQTGYTVRQVSGGLQQLRENQWVDYDEAVMWIRNGLRFDPYVTLANDNQRKGIERWLTELPHSQVLVRFCEYYKITYPFEGVDVKTRVLPRGRSRSSTEEEGKNLEGGQGNQAGEAWPSPAALVALYNAHAPEECATARDLSPKRRDKARVALRAFPDQAWWEHVFEQMRASRFLRGLKNRPGPHQNWSADLDWLLAGNKNGTENYVLVHDGRYLDD